jgi:Secretion system C-terminal sorting domain
MKKLLLFAVLACATQVSAQVLAPPIDFQSTTIPYTFTNFDGGNSTVINNPQVNGINTSSKVGQMVKSVGQIWGGSYLTMTNPIDFSVNKIFKMKVWSPAVGRKVLLKVENASNPAIYFEKQDTSNVANAWEELTFDFTAINTSNAYTKLVLIWELGTMGDGSANFTFLFDDIQLIMGPPPLQQIDLPVTFDISGVDYTMTDFGGNSHIITADPINPSNMVGKVTKGTTAALWAGTTIGTSNGFATPIPFTATSMIMTARVWSPDAGIPVRLKVENSTNPTISVETETLTTTSNEWETVVFNFANQAPGTAAINLASVYQKASIFFNFGTDGAAAGTKIYHFDDVAFGMPCTASSVENHSDCATNYSWNGINYSSSGTYTFSTQNAGECDSTATLNLTLLSNSSSTISATGLDTYTSPSGAIYAATGTYFDTIPNAAGCDSIITINLTMSFTGLDEFALQNVVISPNPATDQVMITVDESNLSKELIIMDQFGRIVFETETSLLNNVIDISSLEKGLYYVRLGEFKAGKLIKQ